MAVQTQPYKVSQRKPNLSRPSASKEWPIGTCKCCSSYVKGEHSALPAAACHIIDALQHIYGANMQLTNNQHSAKRGNSRVMHVYLLHVLLKSPRHNTACTRPNIPTLAPVPIFLL